MLVKSKTLRSGHIDLSASLYFLSVLIFLVAFSYAAVGLGGGSSYTALMALFGLNVVAIPMISLSLNLFVSTIGSYNFLRNKHGSFKFIAPFLVFSIPAAYIGGMWQVPKEVFYWILFISLLFVAARLYLWAYISIRYQFNSRTKVLLSLLVGGLLGLIAGVVGIGGGIYLVPLIVILGLGTEKQAATCGAVFIWLNSVSGLVSRLQYNSINLMNYWPLVIAALLGGFLGSYLGSFKYSPATMDKILGGIVLLEIVFLSNKLFFLNIS